MALTDITKAASELGVSTSTMRRLAREGIPGVYRVRGALRFDLEVLRAHLALKEEPQRPSGDGRR